MNDTMRDVLSLKLDLAHVPGDFVLGIAGRSWLLNHAPATAIARPVITLPGFGASGSSHARMVGLVRRIFPHPSEGKEVLSARRH